MSKITYFTAKLEVKKRRALALSNLEDVAQTSYLSNFYQWRRTSKEEVNGCSLNLWKSYLKLAGHIEN